MKKVSKNNPDSKGKKIKGHYSTSTDCENCTNKCAKGIQYLQRFHQKGQGNGVWCEQ